MENIKCPNCGTEIPIEDAISSRAKERARQEYAQKLEEQRAKIQTEESEKIAERIELLNKEVVEQKKENSELKKKELDLLEKEKDLKEKQEELDLNIRRTLLEKEDEIKQKAIVKEAEKHELVIKEYDKKLEDQKKLIEEMKRKSEQGSMQMQGEVQELALEDMLTNQFPYDDIQPVPKGVKGADVLQVVKNEYQQECGYIVYESKRTKSFSDGWIGKLKDDTREVGASISVIVTEALPKDMLRFGIKDGVWICSFQEVQSLALV
jgi:hypothetical protein